MAKSKKRTSTLTSQGKYGARINIPAQLIEALGWKAGDVVLWTLDEGKSYMRVELADD